MNFMVSKSSYASINVLKYIKHPYFNFSNTVKKKDRTPLCQLEKKKAFKKDIFRTKMCSVKHCQKRFNILHYNHFSLNRLFPLNRYVLHINKNDHCIVITRGKAYCRIEVLFFFNF